MTILSLTAENVKRLSAVHIDANGSPVVVLAGENEAGKSSVLDAIEIALRGKKAMPPQPIRADANGSARIVLDMGDYIVTRTITPSGGGSLAVRNAEGATFASPQALLDRLVGDLTFDPMAFADMPPAEQAAVLRRVCGITTETLDAEIATIYDHRTGIGRDITYTQGALEAMPAADDVDDAADAAALAEQLDQADRAWALHADLDRTVGNLLVDFERAKARVDRATEAAKTADAEFERAMIALEAAQAAADVAQTNATRAHDEEQKARVAGNAAYVAHRDAARQYEQQTAGLPDRAALRAQVKHATEHAVKAEQRRRRQQTTEHLQSLEAQHAELTARIETLRQTKAQALAQATFPIDGLGLSDDGIVTWKGMPFEQASTAIRLRVSVAIGLALNPELKILLVRNGNDLGRTNLDAIAQMAAEAGAQVWIERIDGGYTNHTVLIEDGHIAGAAPPPPAEPKKQKGRNIRADVAAVRDMSRAMTSVHIQTADELPAPDAPAPNEATPTERPNTNLDDL